MIDLIILKVDISSHTLMELRNISTVICLRNEDIIKGCLLQWFGF